VKIFTASQIKEWDAYTISHEPISPIALMERAAYACFTWITEQLSHKLQTAPQDEHHFFVFCGRGNNGADGLAIARMLILHKKKVNVYILAEPDNGTNEFDLNLAAIHKLGTEIHPIENEESIPSLKKGNIVIDALYGIGLNRPVQVLSASLIRKINLSGATVISIDVPSGMYADKSSRGLTRIRANFTLSFQQYKTSILLAENAPTIGEFTLLPIGLHQEFESREPVINELIDEAMIRKIYRIRDQHSHKGTYGHALLVAGSYGKMGAAILSSQACLRSGVGLLTVHVPEVGYQIIQISTPEAMAITGKVIDYSLYTVIGIGPGFGTDEGATQTLAELLEFQHKPSRSLQFSHDKCKLVIDADALNILSCNTGLFAQLPPNSILTPHPKEFDRLFGVSENDFDRINMALYQAKKLHCYIILKGHHSYIATPLGKGYFNNTGNAGMATGGSGDVLTGILTGLAAQGYTALETCLLGVYLHGLAGDLAAKKYTQEAMIAGDMTASLGEAFHRFAPIDF
jgi:hydroxyethylthiazole kinase-like uncharacterized protein yjeF